MIHIHADAVITLTDGFSGAALSGNQVSCLIDGERARPVIKPGGLLVLTDLSPGAHTVVLNAHGFQSETFEITADGGTHERFAMLSPDRHYPNLSGAAALCGHVFCKKKPAPNARIFAADRRTEIKLAQDEARAGDREIKLFTKHRRWPALCVAADKKHSEICLLLSAGELAEPLKFSHKRGTAFYTVREFRTDGEGAYFALLPRAEETTFYLLFGSELLESAAGAGEIADIIF